MPSAIELAALDWARARLKVKCADMSDAAVFPALMRLFDQAQANLFAVCVSGQTRGKDCRSRSFAQDDRGAQGDLEFSKETLWTHKPHRFA